MSSSDKRRVTFHDLATAQPPPTETVAVHSSTELPSTASRPPAPTPAVHHEPSATQDSGRPPTEDEPSATRPAVQPSTPSANVAVRPSARKRAAVHKRRAVDGHKSGKGSDRHRGDKARYDNRISPAIHKRIKRFLIDHEMEQADFAELSAVHFMDHVDVHNNERVDGGPSLDDRRLMIRYKTKPSIINLYLQYNSQNRWRVADDEAALRFNDADIRLVEMGIIQTQFNARFKQINSFQYYVTEIEIVLETPLQTETIDIMLRQGRKRWREAKGLPPEESGS